MEGSPFGSATESIFTYIYIIHIHIVCVIFNLLEYKPSRSSLHSRPLVEPLKWGIYNY